MTKNNMKPGDRVFCEMPVVTEGYFIRDEGEYAYVMWDDGAQGSIRKTFVYAKGEDVPNPIRKLCEALELWMRREGFSISDNHKLQNENSQLQAEVDVCADVVMDLLAGKTVYDEMELPGEKRILEIPISGRARPWDKHDTWDFCSFKGMIRKKAEEKIRTRSIAEWEKEMIEDPKGGELIGDILNTVIEKASEDIDSAKEKGDA